MYAQAEGDAMTIETIAKADILANLLATWLRGLFEPACRVCYAPRHPAVEHRVVSILRA